MKRLLPFLLLASACASAPAARRVASDPPADPKRDGAWTPLVRLKDPSYFFPGTHERPRPDGGWYVTPIHAQLLATGKVLISGWNRPQESYCGDHQGRQNGTSYRIDPARLEVAEPGTLDIVPIPEEPKLAGDVLYCAGHAPLSDGRILFTGGARYEFLDIGAKQQEYGLNYARIYDPAKGAFARIAAPMPGGPHPEPAQLAATHVGHPDAGDWSWYEQGMMWYPTNTRLPGGKILIAGGFARQTNYDQPQFYNKSLSLFDPAGFDAGRDPWQVLVTDEAAPDSLKLGGYDYVHSFVLPAPPVLAGHARPVAIFGGENSTFGFLSLEDGVGEKDRVVPAAHGTRPDSPRSENTTASLLGTGEILVAGGGDNGRGAGNRIDVYDPLKDAWSSFDTGITRLRAASILLPDGTALVLSGEGMYDDSTIGDRRRPTIYDPWKKSFINLAPWSDDPDERGYHNMALLLKDGRVLIGGGRTTNVRKNGVLQYEIGCERTDLRIFSPPYLFQGERPVLSGIEDGATLALGGPGLMIEASGPPPRASRGAVLMALGSETHHFDQNQRYVPVRFEKRVDGKLRILPPESSQIAPEGDYVLYLISEAGVPSLGKTVRVK